MLRIAIQSKGRLNEDSLSLFRELGIEVDDSRRKYLSKAGNFPIELLYLRDDDITGVVAAGSAGLGIVGLNEVVEKGFDIEIVERLGFGACRLSLAIPKGEQYNGPEYFEGRKIATSYPNILKKYLDSKGVSATIEVITGSVEIAPAASIAEAILDVVSSGGTLVANNLKEGEVVLESEAVLIRAGRVSGADGAATNSSGLSAEDEEILSEIRFRLESARISRGKRYLLMNLPESALEEAVRILPAMRSPTVLPLAAKGWCSLHSVVDSCELWDKVRQLKSIGAEGILVLNVDKIIL